jgi:hypothetical protein
MVEPLADQDDVFRAFFRHASSKSVDAFALELFFQGVFEIFLAQRVQAVTCDAGQ